MRDAFYSAANLTLLHAPIPFDPARPLPSRIVLLRWGLNPSSEGTFRVGMKTLAASRLWPELGFGEVVIDFNHNTVPGHPSYQGEPAKVAARSAKVSVVPGEGLIFDEIEWTAEGREQRAHYPDLSPAVKTDENGEVVFVHSAALARNGAVHDLHLLAAGSGAPISETDRHVMRMLGVNETQWRKAASTEQARAFRTLNAPAPSRDVEEELRRQLGITAEVWSRGEQKQKGLRTLSAVSPELRALICKTFGLPAEADDEAINRRLEAMDAYSRRPADAADEREGSAKAHAERTRAHAAELGMTVEEFAAKSDRHTLTTEDRRALRDAGYDIEADERAMAQEEEQRERVAMAKQAASIPPEERGIMERLGISEEDWLKH